MKREEYYQQILQHFLFQDYKKIAASYSDEQIDYRNFFNFFAREYKPTFEELDSIIEDTEDEDICLHYKEIKFLIYFDELREKYPKLMKNYMQISNNEKRNQAQKEFVEDELFRAAYFFAKEVLEEMPDSYLVSGNFARLLNYAGRPDEAIEVLDVIRKLYSQNESISEGIRVKYIEIYFYNQNRNAYIDEVSHLNPFMYRFLLRLTYPSKIGIVGLFFIYFNGGITIFYKMGENSLFIIFGILLFYLWQFPKWYFKKKNHLFFQGVWTNTIIHIAFITLVYGIYLTFTE